MNTIVIDNKIINLEKIHFVRKESDIELLVSFGTDFLRFRSSPKQINDIFNKLNRKSEEFFCNHQ